MALIMETSPLTVYFIRAWSPRPGIAARQRRVLGQAGWLAGTNHAKGLCSCRRRLTSARGDRVQRRNRKSQGEVTSHQLKAMDKGSRTTIGHNGDNRERRTE